MSKNDGGSAMTIDLESLRWMPQGNFATWPARSSCSPTPELSRAVGVGLDELLAPWRAQNMELDSDTDIMRDVYMTSNQRAAYERLRKDAEQYRWLKYDGDRSNSSYIARPLGVYGLGPRLYTHDALDAEIEHSRTVQRSCATGTAMNGANT